MRRLKWWLRGLSQRAFPRATLAALANRTGIIEPEVALLPLLAKTKGFAVDIGANKGVYLYHLARHYQRVAAFEPLPEMASYLERAKPKNCDVYPVALSRSQGEAELQLPRGFNELGTLELESHQQWTESDIVDTHHVKTMPLDAYAFDTVSLLKVDVEGHEIPVLEGARTTIDRDRPTIIIEVEERHRPGAVASVRAWCEALGYDGYFLDGVTVRPIAQFDVSRDQSLSSLTDSVKVGRYLNNFLFFDRRTAAPLLANLRAALEQPARLDLGAALDHGVTATRRQKLTDTLRAVRDVAGLARPV
jgi:FkbM family methyltransferase